MTLVVVPVHYPLTSHSRATLGRAAEVVRDTGVVPSLGSTRRSVGAASGRSLPVGRARRDLRLPAGPVEDQVRVGVGDLRVRVGQPVPNVGPDP